MTLVECAKLLAFIAELDYRKFTEATVEAWHEVLGRYELAECKAAVVDHYNTAEPDFLKPNHLVSRMRVRRNERLANLPRLEVNPVDDHRGPDATKADFANYRSIRSEMADAAGVGLLTRDRYNEYVSGSVPWDEFKMSLRFPGSIEA